MRIDVYDGDRGVCVWGMQADVRLDVYNNNTHYIIITARPLSPSPKISGRRVPSVYTDNNNII